MLEINSRLHEVASSYSFTCFYQYCTCTIPRRIEAARTHRSEVSHSIFCVWPAAKWLTYFMSRPTARQKATKAIYRTLIFSNWTVVAPRIIPEEQKSKLRGMGSVPFRIACSLVVCYWKVHTNRNLQAQSIKTSQKIIIMMFFRPLVFLDPMSPVAPPVLPNLPVAGVPCPQDPACGAVMLAIDPILPPQSRVLINVPGACQHWARDWLRTGKDVMEFQVERIRQCFAMALIYCD